MSERDSQSPVDADSSSVAVDEESGEIKLRQTPGEQPVTIAGGSLGPDVTEQGAENGGDAP